MPWWEGCCLAIRNDVGKARTARSRDRDRVVSFSMTPPREVI
jgi:hypothetical protein